MGQSAKQYAFDIRHYLFLLILYLYAPSVFPADVDFRLLERTENNRWALASYGIDMPSRPEVRRSTLGGRGTLEIGETRCDDLVIVFRESANVSRVVLGNI